MKQQILFALTLIATASTVPDSELAKSEAASKIAEKVENIKNLKEKKEEQPRNL